VIELGVVATLLVMALGWAFTAPADAWAALLRERRRLLREQRAAARDEDERRRAPPKKARIGY
jgi:hypothetical protein